MRLATFRKDGSDRVGVVNNASILDVSRVAESMLDVIRGGEDAIREIGAELGRAPQFPLEAVSLLPPIPRPERNVMCLGLNYRVHVEEGARAGVKVSLPDSPVWFTKPASSLCGPYDELVLDMDLSVQYDWEVELALVIGKAGRRIKPSEALTYVHSYAVFNDLSIRDVQLRGGQWFKGKSLDRSSPLGPWLVTADEVGDPRTLELSCRVDGVVKQRDTVSSLLFDIATCIADISEVLTLQPGDVISTGTPAGVGFARVPPEFLRTGNVLESEIDRIGVLRNRVTAVERRA